MSASLIKVDINRGKLVRFDLDIRGIERELLNGKLVIEVNGVEYGFPAVIVGNKAEVKIPCLFDVIYNIETYKTYMKAYLVLFGEYNYYIPWEGKLKVLTPKKVKARLQKPIKRPVVTREELEFEEVGEQEEIIVDEPEPEHEVTLPQPTEEEKKREITVEKKKITQKPKPQNESTSLLSENDRHEYLERLKNIDEKGIRDYMSRAGTRSTNVQNIILEQAEGKCKDPDDKFELLKSVVKVMNDIKKGGMKK